MFWSNISKVLTFLYQTCKLFGIQFFVFVCMFLIINLLVPSFINQNSVWFLFLFSFFLAYILSNSTRKHLLAALLLSFFFFLFWYFLFFLIADITIDGNTYHLEAILEIFKGKSFFFDVFESKWLNYYPKTLEVMFSGFASFFSNPDMWRIFKIFLIFISFVNVLFLFKKLKHSQLSFGYVFLIAFFSVLNPVVLSQFFTLYLDDILYLLLLNFWIYFFLEEIPLSFLYLTLLFSAKINYAFFWFFALLTMFFVNSIYYKYRFWDLLLAYRQRLAGKTFFRYCVIIVFFLVAFHQYILNYIKYSNPAYWFIWDKRVDIISMFQPPFIRDQNKLSKFFYLYTSYSKNACFTDSCLEGFVFTPFTDFIHNFFSTYSALSACDSNINWFWNIFSFLLFVSLSLFVICCLFFYKQTKKILFTHPYFYIILYILLCVFSLPFPWARYFPLLYLFPFFIIAILNKKRIYCFFIFLYVLNTFLIIYSVFSQYKINFTLKRMQYHLLSEYSSSLPSSVYYTAATGHHVIQKFSSFYSPILSQLPFSKQSKTDLFSLCWIKSDNEIKTSEGWLKIASDCPNWGKIFVTEPGYYTANEFVYIK